MFIQALFVLETPINHIFQAGVGSSFTFLCLLSRVAAHNAFLGGLFVSDRFGAMSSSLSEWERVQR